MEREFCFITDIHIGAGTNVRTGDVYADIFKKLEFVKDYCNKSGARLIIGGDVFDKPTISDLYKAPFVRILREFKEVPLCVTGNHDMLWNTSDNAYKTSLNLLFEAGLLEHVGTQDLGDLIITEQKPLSIHNKSQIFVYHGFLNKEDGWRCVMMDELATTDEVLALLGHDHVEYEPVEIGSVKVIRPGSLLRGIRNSESERTPKIVHIKFNSEWSGRKIRYKLVPIPSRDYNEIFKTKQATITTAEKQATYDAIIQQIVNVSSHEMTFMDAVNTVASVEEAAYIQTALNEASIKKESK